MKFCLCVLFSLFSSTLLAQQATLYHPEADAEKDIAAAVSQAGKENKFVLIQAGGNWCSWCIEFARFAKADHSIDSLIRKDFIWYHLNYSKENFNNKLFAKMKFPQRFGFPVFMVLDGKGELLHTQNSAYLEEDKGYSKSKVMEFLSHWAPAAFDPANYKEQ